MTIFIIDFLAYLMIFMACDINRKPESKIPMFSFSWFLQLILIIIATVILKQN